MQRPCASARKAELQAGARRVPLKSAAHWRPTARAPASTALHALVAALNARNQRHVERQASELARPAAASRGLKNGECCWKRCACCRDGLLCGAGGRRRGGRRRHVSSGARRSFTREGTRTSHSIASEVVAAFCSSLRRASSRCSRLGECFSPSSPPRCSAQRGGGGPHAASSSRAASSSPRRTDGVPSHWRAAVVARSFARPHPFP